MPKQFRQIWGRIAPALRAAAILPPLLFAILLGRGHGWVACFGADHSAIEPIHAPTTAAAHSPARSCSCKHGPHTPEKHRHSSNDGNCTDISLDPGAHVHPQPLFIDFHIGCCTIPQPIAWEPASQVSKSHGPQVRGPPSRHPPSILAALNSVRLLM